MGVLLGIYWVRGRSRQLRRRVSSDERRALDVERMVD
jgi:hypothetical protein